MPKYSKVKFGPTVPACGGGRGHSGSNSSHSSSSSAAPVVVVDPGNGWGGTVG